MSDEYLWDRSGAPDPLVERLEQALAPARRPAGPPPAVRAPIGPWAWGAAAAAVLVASFVGLLQWPSAAPTTPPQAGPYTVSGVAGLERAGSGDHIASADREAQVTLGAIGELTLEPRSSVRVDRVTDAEHRLFLERGAVRAHIWAGVPARTFQIGTPAGLSVDLGCVYRIAVDESGHTQCVVQSGRVAFEAAERRVVVPAGAGCRADPGRGPGTPTWQDAADPWRSAVAACDAGTADDAAIALICAATDARDSLTLWHLLDVLGGTARERVATRLARLVPLPDGVALGEILAGDPGARAAWMLDIEASW